MNCKPGDLAIVLRSSYGHEGKIVRVLSYYGPAHYKSGRYVEHAWICEAPFYRGNCKESIRHGGDAMVPDEDLRPIRPDGITDEEVRELYAPKEPVYA